MTILNREVTQQQARDIVENYIVNLDKVTKNDLIQYIVQEASQKELSRIISIATNKFDTMDLYLAIDREIGQEE